jgi:hypothetical protein
MTQTASANKLRACDVANTARKLTDQQSRKRSHSAAFEAQHPPAFPCRICDIRYRCATSPACIRDISMHSSDLIAAATVVPAFAAGAHGCASAPAAFRSFVTFFHIFQLFRVRNPEFVR